MATVPGTIATVEIHAAIATQIAIMLLMRKREIPGIAERDAKALVDRFLASCLEAQVITERMLKHNGELMHRSAQPEKRSLEIQHAYEKPEIVKVAAVAENKRASHALCWHECPVCQRHWSHQIHWRSSSAPDRYFAKCQTCNESSHTTVL